MNPTAVVRPLPGPGLAARAGDLLMVCADAGDGVEELLGLVTEVAGAGGDGSVLVRRVAALLAADFNDRYPACAASGPTPDGRLAVLVHGNATAEIAGSDGEVRLSADDAIGSVTRLVAGPVSRVRLRLPGAGDAHPRVRLDGGVVPAAGLQHADDDAAPASSIVDPLPPVYYLPPAADLAPPGYPPTPSYEPAAYSAPPATPSYEPAASYEPPATPAYEPYVPPAYEPSPAYEPAAPVGYEPPPAFEPAAPAAYIPPVPAAYEPPAPAAYEPPAPAAVEALAEPEAPARKGFGSMFRKAASSLGKEAASAFGDSLKDAAAGGLKDAASSAVGGAASSLVQNAAGSFGDAAASALGDAVNNAASSAADSAVGAVGDAVGDAAKSALGKVGGALGGAFGGGAAPAPGGFVHEESGAADWPAPPPVPLPVRPDTPAVADWRAVTPQPAQALHGIGEHGEPVVVVPAVPSMRIPSPPEAVAPPMRHPDPNAPFVSMVLAGQEDGAVEPPAPALDQRPRVIGVICPNGHFTDPSVPVCGVCGYGLDERTAVKQEGPRPPLGVLRLDDGSTFRLDLDYVVGREPQGDPEVASGTVRPLRVIDSDGIVSRRHLRIMLVGWNVQAMDLGSANGTTVQFPEEAERITLQPNRPLLLRPGAQISMGRRWLRFESQHTG